MNKIPSEIYIPRILHKYINSFNFYKNGDHGSFSQTMMPLDAVHIIFQLGTTMLHNTTFSNGWEKRPDVFIGGPYNRFYQMKGKPGTEVFSIEFKYGKSRHFMSPNAFEIKNQLIDPQDIWGAAGRLLNDQICHAKNNLERALIAEQFLTGQFRNIPTSSLDKPLYILLKKNGLIHLKELAEMARMSMSNFRKRFREEVGLSPKQFQKIIRTNALIQYRMSNPDISLTDLGYHFEYFDQSHFIKDFKSATGLPPKLFFKQ